MGTIVLPLRISFLFSGRAGTTKTLTPYRDSDGDDEALSNPEFRPYVITKMDLIANEETFETISPRWPAARARAKKAEIGARNFNAATATSPMTRRLRLSRRRGFSGIQTKRVSTIQAVGTRPSL